MSDAAWADPPGHAALPPDEVHVWRPRLDLPDREVRALSALLSPDERARAERLRLPGPRARFATARGWLRHILARYLEADPRALSFRYTETGKPELAGRFAASGIRFNLSHSADLALVAVAAGRTLGIDVECTERPVDALRIADRFFTRAEAACLRGLPPEDRVRAFYRCWTRKEARAKAVGEGLRLVLRDARAEAAQPDPEGWPDINLDPAPGYVGALVVEAGPPYCLKLWGLPPGGADP